MEFRTEVDIQRSSELLSHDDSFLCVGSCFAEHIGLKLSQRGFEVLINPTGAMYNPLSIERMFKRISSEKLYTSDELLENQGIWHSFDHHSSFSGKDMAQVLERINISLMEAAKWMKTCSVLCLTLGSSFAFFHNITGEVVANCHKLHPETFVRKNLDLEAVIDSLSNTIRIVRTHNPNVKIIFTVSPVRHLAYGLHGNQLSKARLLLAIDSLCSTMSNIIYFPAYEIVMDDLRDYRFYNSDMKHPSSTAVDYIFEKFSKAFFSVKTEETANKHYKDWLKAGHKAIINK